MPVLVDYHSWLKVAVEVNLLIRVSNFSPKVISFSLGLKMVRSKCTMSLLDL